MTSVRWGAALAACVILFGGCVSSGRVADLQDSGRFSLGMGIGIAVDAKAGMLTQPSFGTRTASAMFGFDSRFVDGGFYQVSAHDPGATFWAMRDGKSVAPSLNQSMWRAAFEVKSYGAAFGNVGGPITQQRPERLKRYVMSEKLKGTFEEGRWLPLPPEMTFRQALDIQLGFTLFIVSGRVGFNILEFTDFLLGYAGLDIAGDDGIE